MRDFLLRIIETMFAQWISYAAWARPEWLSCHHHFMCLSWLQVGAILLANCTMDESLQLEISNPTDCDD